MKKTSLIPDLKISLPFYKLVYSLLFVVILALVRGVSVSYEIGVTMEPALAILSAAFCADAYALEFVSGRAEVWRLCPLKKRVRAVGRRILIQQIWLLLLSAAGYGFFYLFQKPLTFRLIRPGAVGESTQFFLFLAAQAVTVVFWGMLSNTLACLSRSLWGGIGGSLLLWLLLDSAHAKRLLGCFHVFSYSFRSVDNSSLSWFAGKAICIILCAAMAAALPELLKRR